MPNSLWPHGLRLPMHGILQARYWSGLPFPSHSSSKAIYLQVIFAVLHICKFSYCTHLSYWSSSSSSAFSVNQTKTAQWRIFKEDSSSQTKTEPEHSAQHVFWRNVCQKARAQEDVSAAGPLALPGQQPRGGPRGGGARVHWDGGEHPQRLPEGRRGPERGRLRGNEVPHFRRPGPGPQVRPRAAQLRFAVRYPDGGRARRGAVLGARRPEGLALRHPRALPQPAFPQAAAAGLPAGAAAVLPDLGRVPAHPAGGRQASRAGKRVLHQTAARGLAVRPAGAGRRPREAGERSGRGRLRALLVPAPALRPLPNAVAPRPPQKPLRLPVACGHGQAPDPAQPQEAPALRRRAFGRPLQELASSASRGPAAAVGRRQDAQRRGRRPRLGPERLPLQNAHQSSGGVNQPLYLGPQPAEEVVQRPPLQRTRRE